MCCEEEETLAVLNATAVAVIVAVVVTEGTESVLMDTVHCRRIPLQSTARAMMRMVMRTTQFCVKYESITHECSVEIVVR